MPKNSFHVVDDAGRVVSRHDTISKGIRAANKANKTPHHTDCEVWAFASEYPAGTKVSNVRGVCHTTYDNSGRCVRWED